MSDESTRPEGYDGPWPLTVAQQQRLLITLDTLNTRLDSLFVKVLAMRHDLEATRREKEAYRNELARAMKKVKGWPSHVGVIPTIDRQGKVWYQLTGQDGEDRIGRPTSE